MWSKRISRILMIALGVLAAVVIFGAGLWSTPTSDPVVASDMMRAGTGPGAHAGSADSAAALDDPLLPTAIQRRDEQIRTDRLGVTPEPIRSIGPVGSPEENQAQVPMILRLAIVAGCLSVAIGSGWIIYARSRDVVESGRSVSVDGRRRTAPSPTPVDPVVVQEPVPARPVVAAESIVATPAPPEPTEEAVVPQSSTDGVESLEEMIRALNETVHAFDSRLADLVLASSEERSQKPRATEPRRIEFVSEEDLSPETPPMEGQPTESVVSEAPSDASTAQVQSGAALSLIRSRRSSRTPEAAAEKAPEEPRRDRAAASHQVADVTDLDVMRERVLELAGRGLPAADISRQVGLSRTEVSLILRTLFDSGRPGGGPAAIRAAE